MGFNAKVDEAVVARKAPPRSLEVGGIAQSSGTSQAAAAD